MYIKFINDLIHININKRGEKYGTYFQRLERF